MKRIALSWMLAGIGSLAVLAIAATPDEKKLPAPEATSVAAPNDDLIVHEWGTFTTFSGSNGVHLEFRPLAANHSDLPDFVWDRSSGHPELLFSKSRLRCRVRMETPVTYFYTDRERTVRASVGFPQGLLTEFYPPVQSMMPPFDAKAARGDGEKIGNSSLDWGKIRLIPTKAFLPQITNSADAEWLQGRIVENLCPPGNGHYAAARATDSAFVLSERDQQRHLEKFLFYRGVGKFDLPVQVVAGEDGEIRVSNRDDKAIRSVFLLESRESQLSLSRLDQINAGETAVMGRPQPLNWEDLRESMVSALLKERLYEKEARAMVATWHDSWFMEEGTRVFYMVPQTVTDALLPLKIEPRPKETVRVLVARMEVMRSSTEKRLLDVVKQSAEARRVATDQQKDLPQPMPVSLPIPEEITKLGRLAEPALVRVESISREATVRNEAELLLWQLRMSQNEQ